MLLLQSYVWTAARAQANPSSRATVSDVSPTAVANLLRAIEVSGVPPSRVHASVLDAASCRDPCSHLADLNADACMLVFTLSAVPPEDMRGVLEVAYGSLRPGGNLFVRDYGRFDLTSLRFPPEQRLSDGLYYRCVESIAPIKCSNRDTRDATVLGACTTCLLTKFISERAESVNEQPIGKEFLNDDIRMLGRCNEAPCFPLYLVSQQRPAAGLGATRRCL
jgi:hypothetical protein